MPYTVKPERFHGQRTGRESIMKDIETEDRLGAGCSENRDCAEARVTCVRRGAFGSPTQSGNPRVDRGIFWNRRVCLVSPVHAVGDTNRVDGSGRTPGVKQEYDPRKVLPRVVLEPLGPNPEFLAQSTHMEVSSLCTTTLRAVRIFLIVLTWLELFDLDGDGQLTEP